jgi:hypothetical protein
VRVCDDIQTKPMCAYRHTIITYKLVFFCDGDLNAHDLGGGAPGGPPALKGGGGERTLSDEGQMRRGRGHSRTVGEHESST